MKKLIDFLFNSRMPAGAVMPPAHVFHNVIAPAPQRDHAWCDGCGGIHEVPECGTPLREALAEYPELGEAVSVGRYAPRDVEMARLRNLLAATEKWLEDEKLKHWITHLSLMLVRGELQGARQDIRRLSESLEVERAARAEVIAG